MSCSDINSLPNLAALLGVSVDELMQIKKRTPTSKENLKEIIDMIFKAVALAMGIAVIVLSVLNKLAIESGIVLLGIGMTRTDISLFNIKE